MSLSLVPITLREARRFVGEHHRHNLPPKGWRFGVGVVADGNGNGALVGVGIAGRPTAEALDDGHTLEILRVCTDGTRNACSMVYGALSRAAFALGYRRCVTYTLATEPGSSLRASGWTFDAHCDDLRGWNRPKRPRQEVDLFGNETTPQEAKLRWVRLAS